MTRLFLNDARFVGHGVFSLCLGYFTAQAGTKAPLTGRGGDHI